MKYLIATAEQALAKARQHGSEKAQVSVSSTRAQEFNVEGGRLTLLRTTYDQDLTLQCLQAERQALVSGNQLNADGVTDLAVKATEAMKVAPPDACNGFAPNQGQKSFVFGEEGPNEDWMYSGLTTTLAETKQKYPQVIIDASTIKYVTTQKALLSSESTLLQAAQSYYDSSIMFSAKVGNKASSFNYTSFRLPTSASAQSISLLKIGHLDELLRQNSEQIHSQKLPGKFEGEVIVTPHCMADLLEGWIGYLSGGRMLKGTSFFSGKLGQQVASTQWSLSAQPLDSKFASRRFWTSDGYLTNNEVIFEKGVLKNYVLGHFVGKKLGQAISRSEGGYLRLAPGTKKLQEMISSVKKGVLMCRYSAGNPAENGEISGVAKNSYYIENGEIRFPLGETMVSLNLARMLHEVRDISQETVSSGYWETPWVRFGGALIS